ncbi:NAC domain-containing protein 21/22-like [Diospyros lotus]|uniref:NAC domain-containing protein 21/22-like n=1 Tax=Diospyros lotus TaxID=55363 RepID=UPI002256A2D8|nr:NAC domain-containing protein 21/22-like [Diospyros lotus]
MGLRDIGASLPPGFRFYPSDEELVCHYLFKKIANEDVLKGTLVEIDLHTCEPWQLPEVAKLNSSEWYFFSFRDRKYATGFRTNRATTSGYWKATGKDRTVHDPRTRAIVGMRKTLVFYRNRAPNGIKTGWIMHEFRLENPHMPPKEDWVLCRVFHKGKGENSSARLSPENVFESSTAPPSSPPPPPDHHPQSLPFLQNHHPAIPSFSQTHHPSSGSLLDLSPFIHPNFLHSSTSRDMNNASIGEINSKCEQDYELLLDMGLEESSLGDGVHPSFGEIMRFEEDDDASNGLIFL